MQVIIDFFKGFADIVSSLVDFVIDMVNDLVYVVKLLTEVLSQLPTFFTWLPAEVWAVLAVLFSIVVIYKIIGREG